MAHYTFDIPVERRDTNSIKWSGGEQAGRWFPYPSDPGPPAEAPLLPMWLADMDFAAAPEIRVALRQRLDHGVFGYTYYDESFYQAIAGWASLRHGWTPQREWIFTNSGVMPAINLLIQTLTEPGDGVIVQSPVFHPIPQAAEFNGRRAVDSPLRLVDGRYEMDFVDLESKTADPSTKLMVLCSPHNPVGRVWTRKELGRVAELCAANGVVLVSDEVHGDLTYQWANFVSAGSLSEHHERLVVCTGPSKAFNLPALKFSLTIIPDEHLRAAFGMTLRNQNELWAANLLGAVATEAAYNSGGPWLEELIAYLTDNFDYVERFLATRLPQLELIRPDALYLAWIDCRKLGLSGTELDKRLRAAGLWVEQGATYGGAGEGFIRMTVACSRSVVEEAMRRLERAVG